MIGKLVHAKGTGLFLALAVVIATPFATRAQSQGEDTATLTLKNVKERIKQNKNYLEEAKDRGKAGDAAGMETALENYERGTRGLDRALASGRFEGDVYDREEAFNRVEKATGKHSEVLTDLLESGKIPEQARPHVEHALQVSQKGREMALTNLQEARAQRRQHEASGQGRGQSGVYGRSGGAGQPGGIGGRPSGVGTPGGMGGAPASTPGAGRGAGGGRGPG